MKKLFLNPLAVAICAVALFSCSEETMVNPEIESEESSLVNQIPCYDSEGLPIGCKDTGPEYN